MTENTRNEIETALIEWDEVMFTNNLYAYFEYGMVPILGVKIEDVLLPEDYVYEKSDKGYYEIFGYDEECEEYTHSGRLYIPKGHELSKETEL